MAKKMILLYACPDEVRYVYYEPKVCIGVGATRLEHWIPLIQRYDEVHLFGSSGWLGPRKGAPINCLIVKKKFLFVPEPVHDDKWTHHFRHFRYYLIDQESYQVNELCKKYNKPFRSVRYVIDFCDRRVMPIGINHFWRMIQHRRMQTGFDDHIRKEFSCV